MVNFDRASFEVDATLDLRQFLLTPVGSFSSSCLGKSLGRKARNELAPGNGNAQICVGASFSGLFSVHSR
jgi:hypothetical protein